jgi:hypothetical protein
MGKNVKNVGLKFEVIWYTVIRYAKEAKTSNCVASRKYSISEEMYGNGGMKNGNYWEKVSSELHSVNLKWTTMKSWGKISSVCVRYLYLRILPEQATKLFSS